MIEWLSNVSKSELTQDIQPISVNIKDISQMYYSTDISKYLMTTNKIITYSKAYPARNLEISP